MPAAASLSPSAAPLGMGAGAGSSPPPGTLPAGACEELSARSTAPTMAAAGPNPEVLAAVASILVPSPQKQQDSPSAPPTAARLADGSCVSMAAPGSPAGSAVGGNSFRHMMSGAVSALAVDSAQFSSARSTRPEDVLLYTSGQVESIKQLMGYRCTCLDRGMHTRMQACHCLYCMCVHPRRSAVAVQLSLCIAGWMNGCQLQQGLPSAASCREWHQQSC